MGLSFFGGLAWLAAVLGSLLWPALLAWLYERWQAPRIGDRERFLSRGILLSYAVILGLHLLLGGWVRSGAEQYAVTGSWLDAWGPVLTVLVIENGAAVFALSRLQQHQRRAFRRREPEP
jgi:hypothetical protein